MKIKRQEDIKDCGIVCIQAFYKYYFKKWLNINDLKLQANYSQNGLNLIEMQQLAYKNNLNMKILEGDFLSFIKLEITKPLIVLINNNNLLHYIIVVNKVNKKYEILDPSKGKYWITEEELQTKYLNVILSIEKGNRTISYNFSKNSMLSVFNNLKLILFSIILSVIVFILNIFSSYLTKQIIENIAYLKNDNWITIIFILSFWVIISRISINFSLSMIENKIQINLVNNINKLLADKLINANLISLNKLDKSDIFNRFFLVNMIAQYQSHFLLIIFSQSFGFIISIIFLWSFNIYLTIITFLSLLIVLLISLLFNFFNKPKYENLIKLSEQNINNFLNFVLNSYQNKNIYTNSYNYTSFIETNKNYLLKSYSYYQNKLSKDKIINFIMQITPVIIMFVGIKIIYKDQLNLGTIIIFSTFYNFLLNPVLNISSIISEYTTYKINLNKINFILNIETQNNFQPFRQFIQCNSIKIQNLEFGYVPSVKILKINHLNLNKHSVLESKNGSGKTTFLRIIAKHFDYQGSIKINDVEIKDFNNNEIYEKVLYLNKNILFAAKTVFEQITLKNISLENQFYINFKSYNLQNILDYANIKLDTQLENNASNLSNGQQAIVNIFNIFANSYSIILFDEVFEHLDEKVFDKLKEILQKHLKNVYTIEVSHSKKYIFNENIINLNEV
ncbi:Mbov_0121 family peptidase domain-containing ABC transporter [Mycoplasma miroungirhinis]|uniref:ATP-binding cassette domain-containing protein n=1 Tax=Mycoplasma miroungirhinis TaxID=754516 RepID=A0A6M4JHD1_9MOLU|nr:cysteine peptidase family C39 domain-containing protein [Mycoplasma miroungirhinis]QJR44432.1 ATP-binding cassette domain-containing protein [Mycoplasma miroungirhinis]